MARFDVTFLLVPRFSMIALYGAMEPLRVANRFAGNAFSWRFVSSDGKTRKRLERYPVSVSGGLADVGKPAMAMVCASYEHEAGVARPMLAAIRRLARAKVLLAGLDTGPFVLAEAGVLDGYRATCHWESLPGFRESYRAVQVREACFERDRDRMTCAGGAAAIDMMLAWINDVMGRELSVAVADSSCTSARANRRGRSVSRRGPVSARVMHVSLRLSRRWNSRSRSLSRRNTWRRRGAIRSPDGAAVPVRTRRETDGILPRAPARTGAASPILFASLRAGCLAGNGLLDPRRVLAGLPGPRRHFAQPVPRGGPEVRTPLPNHRNRWQISIVWGSCYSRGDQVGKLTAAYMIATAAMYPQGDITPLIPPSKDNWCTVGYKVMVPDGREGRVTSVSGDICRVLADGKLKYHLIPHYIVEPVYPQDFAKVKIGH